MIHGRGRLCPVPKGELHYQRRTVRPPYWPDERQWGILGHMSSPRVVFNASEGASARALTFPTLERPPILEAVLDIRFRARTELEVGELFALREVLSETFPTSEEMKQMGAKILFERTGARTETEEPRQIGVLFKSKDEKLIFQARVDGITLSRLAPYRSFDELEPLLRSCWGAYVRAARPEAATRIAVRYINRFEVPIDTNLTDWLTRPPQPAVPWVRMGSFVHRDLWRAEDEEYAVGLVTALEPGLNGRSSQLIVDIDAFSEVRPISISADDPEASLPMVRERFSALRSIKNHFFFSLLTPKCIQTFQ